MEGTLRESVTPWRLSSWIEESDSHLNEVADIVVRRSIGLTSWNRYDAKKWIKTKFMLPKTTKTMDLFDPINEVGRRQEYTNLIVKAVRDRLKADRKRWDEKGYRTKSFLETLEG